MALYNDGRGEALYIGGSFSSAGGLTTRGIARYSRAGQWGAVGGGCYSTNTNYFVAALATHDFAGVRELVSGGGFATAGNVAGTANLASWNGTRWRPLGAPDGAVWSILSYNGMLYAAGGFQNIGGVAASGIAVYNGTSWSPLGAGMSGGFSPCTFVIKVFNDGSGEKLYAGGRFGSMGGINGLVARWNGSAWQTVGRGVIGSNTFSGIESMTVFNDGSGNALYVGGYDIRPVGGITRNVAKWNGTAWTTVGQYLGGRTTALAVFDDGSGPALFAAGTAQPDIAYVARLVGTQWVTLSGGVGQDGGPPWPSAFGLLPWQGKLYVAGDFDYVGTNQTPAFGLAAWTSCTEACPADFNRDGFVDFFDYLGFVGCFEGEGCPPGATADFDGDGFVDFFDLSAFTAAFEEGC
jgi:hypothetical protein